MKLPAEWETAAKLRPQLMHSSSLNASPVTALVDACLADALQQSGRADSPRIVISPYRFNPLGAHIDHQGGAVLARCLDQYTVCCFWPSVDRQCTIHARLRKPWQQTNFLCGDLRDEHGWDAMVRASVAALDKSYGLERGIEAVVFGTLVSGGLSSSASVILAYLSALADVNDIELSARELVDLSRQVENDYRGLNNGIQDQMSIAFAQQHHLAMLDVENVSAELIADPDSASEVCFLMCYSGVSRDLGGSPFNARVAECQQAAQLLSPGVHHLGQVSLDQRTAESLSALPDLLQRRARHVYTEMGRVHAGAEAWRQGDWQGFGRLMNQSCRSSIVDYESGSEWLIALHEIARGLSSVYGNRFSGGGYGGCLFMLVNRQDAQDVSDAVLSQYLDYYPGMQGLARTVIAESESSVRIVQP